MTTTPTIAGEVIAGAMWVTAASIFIAAATAYIIDVINTRKRRKQ